MMLSEKDYAHSEEQQRRSSLSASALIRSLLVDLGIKECLTEMIMQVCRELNAAGNNLNQPAWAANQGVPVSVEQLAAIRQTSGQLWYRAKLDSEPTEIPRK